MIYHIFHYFNLEKRTYNIVQEMVLIVRRCMEICPLYPTYRASISFIINRYFDLNE